MMSVLVPPLSADFSDGLVHALQIKCKGINHLLIEVLRDVPDDALEDSGA